MEYVMHSWTTRQWRRGRVTSVNTCAIFLCLSFIISPSYCSSSTGMSCATAITNKGQIVTVMPAKLTLIDSQNEKPKHVFGSYAVSNSRINNDPLQGALVKVRTKNNGSELGCSEIDPSIIPKNKTWIALVKRGNCSFNEKVAMATKRPNDSNASAVVIYNNVPTGRKCVAIGLVGDTDLLLVIFNDEHIGRMLTNFYINMNTEEPRENVSDVVTVYVPLNVGRDLLTYMNSTVDPLVTISRLPDTSKPTSTPDYSNSMSINNTSMLFVSISFIVLIHWRNFL